MNRRAYRLTVPSKDLFYSRRQLWICEIEIDRADMNEASFVTQNGLYKYGLVGFGLNTVLDLIWRAIDIILATVR